MKNICTHCKFAKHRFEGTYCIKYGIVVRHRVYCVAYEPDKAEKDEEDEE